MSRTYRTDLDGSIVKDGKAFQAQDEHNDPWDSGVPYNRANTRKELKDAILEYVRGNKEATTTQIIDHFLQDKTRNWESGVGQELSWTILELLDELKQEDLLQ